MEGMINKVRKLIACEAVQYIIYGILTTLINIVTYMFLTRIGINYIISNVIAFIISIIFAFITNKVCVFKSYTWEKVIVLRESITFISARISTFIIDMVLMIIFIEYMNINNFIAKVIVNIVVIVINYIISKLIVFKKR